MILIDVMILILNKGPLLEMSNLFVFKFNILIEYSFNKDDLCQEIEQPAETVCGVVTNGISIPKGVLNLLGWDRW
jgi:hypothetical protein